MPANAEILEKNIILATCRKILLAMEMDCKSLEDVKEYITELIAKAEG